MLGRVKNVYAKSDKIGWNVNEDYLESSFKNDAYNKGWILKFWKK